MKKNKLIILVILSMFFVYCNDNSKYSNINVKNIDFKSFSIDIKKNNINDKNLGKVVKVIKLETTKKSIIGEISSLSINNNGDYLINDFNRSKKVFLFNKNGKYIRNYGKKGQGPGEYEKVRGTAILENGDVILVTSLKLIKFNIKGKLIKEIKINYLVKDIIVNDELIYLSVYVYRSSKINKNSILIYNSKLDKVGGIVKYDTRLEKYRFVPHKVLAKINNSLAFIDYYDLKLQIYNPKALDLSIIKIPNENNNLDSIWGKKNFSEDDRTIIKKKLHRFNSIFGFNNSFSLFEICKEKNIYNAWLLNLKDKKIKIFSYDSLDDYTKKMFYGVKGCYDKGIIFELYCYDEKEFNKYQKKIPLLKNFRFNMDDNPFLVKYEFKNF